MIEGSDNYPDTGGRRIGKNIGVMTGKSADEAGTTGTRTMFPDEPHHRSIRRLLHEQNFHVSRSSSRLESAVLRMSLETIGHAIDRTGQKVEQWIRAERESRIAYPAFANVPMHQARTAKATLSCKTEGVTRNDRARRPHPRETPVTRIVPLPTIWFHDTEHWRSPGPR
jgi:hypothetical protein